MGKSQVAYDEQARIVRDYINGKPVIQSRYVRLITANQLFGKGQFVTKKVEQLHFFLKGSEIIIPQRSNWER